MFALIVLLLSVFCVCFNCALTLADGVLCSLLLCSCYRCSVFALIVFLLSVLCGCFNCALAIGVLYLL